MSSATPQSTKTAARTTSRTAGTRTPKRAALAGFALVAAGPLLLAACGASPDENVSVVAHDAPTTTSGVPSTAGATSAMASDKPSASASGSASGGPTGTGDATPRDSSSKPASSSAGLSDDVTGTASAGCSAATPKVWGKPVQTEDFDNTSSSPSGWNVYHDTTSDSLRDPSQVKVSGGNLQLIGTTKSGKSIGGGVSDQFSQKYGRWEACVRADRGDGYYPVITIWPDNNDWPTGGEIDLLESVDGQRVKNIFFVHNNAANNRKGTRFEVDLTQWHEFAVDWTPHQIVYYVDGVAMWTMTDQNLVPTRTTMHMTFQLDARNKPICHTSCRTASTPPHPTMYVNWMKAYKYDGQAG